MLLALEADFSRADDEASEIDLVSCRLRVRMYEMLRACIVVSLPSQARVTRFCVRDVGGISRGQRALLFIA